MNWFITVLLAALLPSAHVKEIPPNVLSEPVIGIAEASDRLHKAAGGRVFFRLEGRITGMANDHFVLRDATGAVFVMSSCDDSWRPGDTIRLVGTALPEKNGSAELFVEALAIETLSNGKPDVPEPITPIALARTGYDYKFVRLLGTVTDAFRDEVDPQWNILTIEADGSKAIVWLKDADRKQEELNALIECVVSIDGITLPYHNGSRRYLGPYIQASSKDAIKIESQAPKDPFAAATKRSSPASLGGTNFGPGLRKEPNGGMDNAAQQFPQRICLSGTVTATWSGRRLFLKTDSGGYIEVRLNRDCHLPPVGVRVTVSGFMRKNIFYPRLSNALVRIDTSNDDAQAKELPAATTPRRILFDESGEKQIRSVFNGRLVRISGHVCDVIIAGSNELRIILNSDGITVPVIMGGGIRAPEVGSEIEVVGACLLTSEDNEENDGFVRLEGMSVIVRDEKDITILRNPPWWTTGRLLMVIGALVVIIAGILTWNISLRILAERRGRKLFREQAARLQANMKVEERTRLAVELHDSLSQTLTGIALLVDSATKANEGGSALVNRFLDTVRQMLASCRRELQGCLWDLRSRTFEEKDMSEAVMRTISPNIGDAKLSVRFNVPRLLLSETAMHTVLRIVRELVVNAVRHGRATKVNVAGEYHGGTLRFSVRDNGCGFDTSSAEGPSQGHFGLQGIRERLNDFNGRMDIESSPGYGTKAVITMVVRKGEDDGKHD